MLYEGRKRRRKKREKKINNLFYHESADHMNLHSWRFLYLLLIYDNYFRVEAVYGDYQQLVERQNDMTKEYTCLITDVEVIV